MRDPGICCQVGGKVLSLESQERKYGRGGKEGKKEKKRSYSESPREKFLEILELPVFDFSFSMLSSDLQRNKKKTPSPELPRAPQG